MAAQGFRLEAFQPGQVYKWDYQGATYKLTLENANEAQLWKINPTDARALVESVPFRSVDLKIRVKIIGAIPEGVGGTLQGKVVGYQVFTGGGMSQQIKRGEMAFR